MNIAYDARMSLGQYRGMGRFVRQLIAGREDEVIGLCADGEGDPSLNLIASGLRPYPLWEQLSIPRLIRANDIDVFIAPYSTAPLRLPPETILVLIVHDLIAFESLAFSRSMYQNAGRIYRRLVLPRVINRAGLVVTVSNFTAKELVSRFGVDRRKIRVVPNSIGEGWFIPSSHLPREHYVLAVSGEAPSKNLDRAIEAFALCRSLNDDATLRIKIAGVNCRFHSAFQAVARRYGVADSVDFLNYVSELELRRLYWRAELFLLPSLSEGFGIPVLEAMASGAPVAASAGTSLREVAGDAARYFDPTSIQDMAGTMAEILRDRTLRSSMSTCGRKQARNFHSTIVSRYVRDFWAELEGMAELAQGREQDQWSKDVCSY